MACQIIIIALISIALIGIVSAHAPTTSPSEAPRFSNTPPPRPAPTGAPPPKSSTPPTGSPKSHRPGGSPDAYYPPTPFRGGRSHSHSPPAGTGGDAALSDAAPADAPSAAGASLKGLAAAGVTAIATYLFYRI